MKGFSHPVYRRRMRGGWNIHHAFANLSFVRQNRSQLFKMDIFT